MEELAKKNILSIGSNLFDEIEEEVLVEEGEIMKEIEPQVQSGQELSNGDDMEIEVDLVSDYDFS